MTSRASTRGRIWIPALLTLAALGLAQSSCDAMGPFGLAARGAPNVTIPPEGPSAGQGAPTLVPAFPGILPFDEPIDLVPMPGANTSVVIEQDGRLQIFDTRPDVTTKSVFLDITDRVSRAGFIDERGLLGCAFDPGYASNGFFYCYYTRTGDNAGVLSRFQRDRNNLMRANPASEVRLLVVPQPEANHNGGDVAFSPTDGFLYLTLGDGGGANDNHGPTGNAQRLDMLLGSLLRIDPERDADGGYRIPPSNPFGSQRCPQGSSPNGQPCGEIFHFGLRHPWRFSFDAMTGDGWIGDVGQGAQEEVDFWSAGESGVNYGWACREGTIAGPKPNVATCDSPNERRDPVTTFSTRANPSVIGGYVYRGNTVGQLQGLYVYAGFNPGTLMATDRAGNSRTLDISTRGAIHGIGEDAQREIYVVYGNGGIDRLDAAGGGGGAVIPMRLSQTGIFQNTRATTLRGAPGVVPYDVQARLFSDNLDKERFLAIPQGTRITFTPTGRWIFPPGSAIAKTFLFQGRRIETRVLVRGSDRWRGYTYEWDGAQNDALLVPAEGRTVTLANGQVYDLPSRNGCIRCHNDRSNSESQIIGVQTRQLNRTITYPETGIADNQLRALNQVGYFDRNIGGTGQYEVFPDYADPQSGSLNRRARAYLDQNCGFCHRDGGGTPVGLRLEFDEPLDSLLGVPADSGPVAGAQLIVDPGRKENSVLWQRMRAVINDQVNRGPSMPPLSHRQVDRVGVQLIGDWIDRGLPDPVASVVYSEGGGGESASDMITIRNDGNANITAVLLSLSTSNGIAQIDTSSVALSAQGNVGFDGVFNNPNPLALGLNFTDFRPGRTFTLRLDLDDRNGGLTTGSDLAGARVAVNSGGTGRVATFRLATDAPNQARAAVLAD